MIPKVKAAIIDGTLVISIPVLIKLEEVRADGSAIHLSRREREVFEAIAAGLQNKEIGGKLHLAMRTVKFYVHEVMKKFDVHNRHDLVKIKAKIDEARALE